MDRLMEKYFKGGYRPKLPARQPTGPPPAAILSHEADWKCLAASGAIEGPKALRRFGREPITRKRATDFSSGFGLGLFAGAVGALIVLGQIAQWGAK